MHNRSEHIQFPRDGKPTESELKDLRSRERIFL